MKKGHLEQKKGHLDEFFSSWFSDLYAIFPQRCGYETGLFRFVFSTLRAFCWWWDMKF